MKKNILYSKFYILNNNQRGQIALIVLTVMAVALTLGLSMSRRAVTDVSISEKEQESSKAFSAAEAGIEEALRGLGQGETSVEIAAGSLGVDNVTVNISEVGQTADYIYPLEYIEPGDSVVIWLRDHNVDGTIDFASGYSEPNITLCWENEAAVEITYFYEDGGSYEIQRWAFDPDATRANDNGFDDAGSWVCNDDQGNSMENSADLSLTGTPLFLSVKTFHERTGIAVSAAADLPSQGYEVYSTAEVQQTTNDEKISRRIRAFKTWNMVPDSLFNVLFSGTGISGN